jgi:acyl-CoA reductase-like NAD-dependent aldehyde dehydrogenase
MTGANDHNPDGWTFATIYKHFTALSDASKEAVTAAIQAASKAVDKAEAAQQLRNEVSNEWRAAMTDQQKNFADKEATDRRLKSLEENEKLQVGKERGIGMIGSLIIGGAVLLSTLVAAAAFVYSVVGHK